MKQIILIPIDGTESIKEVLLYTNSITTPADTRLVLIHVTSGMNTVNSRDEIHPNVNIIYSALNEKGWDVEEEIKQGDPVEEIIKFAASLPTTLILMSTHGRSGIERIREGSVTEQVLKQSPCPVFILHSSVAEPADNRTEQLFRRIFVPLDGTDTSSAILGCVKQFAHNHDAEVVLFHDDIEQQDSEQENNAIKTRLENQSVELANSGLKVSLDMSSYKRPIREILERVDTLGIDLVAMATHGKEGKKRALDESVTAEVIRHVKCPLLVWAAEPQCPAQKA